MKEGLLCRGCGRGVEGGVGAAAADQAGLLQPAPHRHPALQHQLPQALRDAPHRQRHLGAPLPSPFSPHTHTKTPLSASMLSIPQHEGLQDTPVEVLSRMFATLRQAHCHKAFMIHEAQKSPLQPSYQALAEHCLACLVARDDRCQRRSCSSGHH